VETVAARTGTGLGRDHHSQRGCLVRHRPVSTGRQQGDALGQGRLQVALEHGDRYFLVAIALAADAANAELRVLGVPGVDRQVALVALGVPETIGHRAQLQPFGLDRLGPLPLAQEQDVGLHLGGRDAGEGALGEPDGTQQVSLTCDVLAHRVVLGIHRVAAGDEAHQPTGAHQVEGAAEEVVVDAEAGIGPVAHVGDLVLAEGDVADHQVEPVVGQGSFLERRNPHVHAAGRVERLEDAAGNPVDLDGGDAAALGQIPRHGADEMADAGGGSRMRPPVKPKRSTACHIASITGTSV
jgi:hypothetical protein